MDSINKLFRRIKILVGAAILVGTHATGAVTAEEQEQEVKLKWETTYEQMDWSSGLLETSDGGYVFRADALSSPNAKDVVMKVNGSGKLKWEKALEAGYTLRKLHETKEGDYLLMSSDPQGQSYRLTKLDQSGQNITAIDVQANSDVYLTDVTQAEDGGYFLVGYKYAGCCTRDGYDNNYEVYIVKTNKNGEMEWEKTLEGDYREKATDVKLAEDGGIFILGDVQKGENMARLMSIYAAKLSSDGTVEWTRNYEAPKRTAAYSVAFTNDGGYVITGGYGYTDYADWQDILVLKLDRDGKQEWLKTYDVDRIDSSHFIKQTEDGGYVVLSNVGSSNVEQGNPKTCILYLNSSGEKRSTVLLTSFVGKGIVTKDNGYVFLINNDSSIRLVKYEERE